MGKQEELIKLDRSIKDAEVRLRTFTSSVDIISKEIEFLLNVEKQLEDNISYLKNNKIIALAAEYRKAKEDLKKTRAKISQAKMDKTINEKAYTEVKAFLEKNQEAFNKLEKAGENNVISGKFGKSRGNK